MILCVTALAWYLCGYGLAFGDAEEYVGTNAWLYTSVGFEKVQVDHYMRWAFEFANVALCAILFTGPLAERAQMVVYVAYSFILAGFIYPIMAAWVWGNGWLQ